MRPLIFALVAGWLWSSPAQADDFSYANFVGHVRDLTNQMLAHCRERASSLLDYSSHPDALANPDAFRWACGKGLDGREVPHTNYRFAYAEHHTVKGGWDVLGVSKGLEHDGQSFTLIVGQMTTISTPRSGDTSRSTVAVATLFDADRKPVWRYVNQTDSSWNRVPLSLPEATPALRAFLDQVWLTEVTLGTARLLTDLHDNRNGTFP